MFSATAAPRSSSMSVTMTSAPSRASSMAQAAPIPDAPPVTIATLPSTCPMGSGGGGRKPRHLANDRRAHLGGADDGLALGLDVGRPQTLGERRRDRLLDEVRGFRHAERITQRQGERGHHGAALFA